VGLEYGLENAVMERCAKTNNRDRIKQTLL
jgi:hypothetical protein